jgi:hypothetical protein
LSPAILSAVKQPGRYAAGTKSRLSKWLRALGLKRFDSAQDIADYDDGATLKAACLIPARRRGIYGYIQLGKGLPVVWRRRWSSATVTFHGDFALTPAAVPRGLGITARMFAYFVLTAGTERHLIGVIKEDLPLVRHALSIPDDYGAAEARAGQPGWPEEASSWGVGPQEASAAREQALTPRNGFLYLARGLPWWQQVVALAPLASIPFVGAIGGGFAGAAAFANISLARKPLPALSKVVAMITVWILAFVGYATVVTGIHLALSSPTASTTVGPRESTQPVAPPAPSSWRTPSPTPSPPSPTAVDVNQPNVIHPTGAELSWPQYANTTGDPAYDLAEYQVHRATTAFFTPSAATLIARVDAQQTSFVDTTAKPMPAEYPASYCTYMVAVLTKSGKLIPGPARLVQLPQTGRTTVAIPATAAGTLSSAQPGSVVDHIGSAGAPGASVEVGDDTNGLGTTRAVFGFDPLPALPASAFVVDARLRLSGGAGGVNARYTVHALNRGFTASEATWNSAAAGTAWTKPGGDYSKLEGVGLPSSGEAGSLADLDATAIVRGWLDSPTADHDLLLKLADETPASQDRAIFAGMTRDSARSRDAQVYGLGTGGAAEPPLMMITYTSGPPDTPYLTAWMPAVMRPGDTVSVPVVVRNTSATRWPAGRVQLTWHWMLGDGTGLTSGQAALPTSLAPGAETTVTVQMTAPRTTYTQIRILVQWDMYDTGTHTHTSARQGVQQQLIEVDSQ